MLMMQQIIPWKIYVRKKLNRLYLFTDNILMEICDLKGFGKFNMHIVSIKPLYNRYMYILDLCP